MDKIAVFTDDSSEVCDFFDASRFLIFEKTSGGWVVTSELAFEKLTPSSPAQMRQAATELLPLLEGCKVLAGGALVGIAFSIFDRAGLHIFEINAADDDIFDSMLEDIRGAGADRLAREKLITETHPIETNVPGVYALDLIALQRECPEISSKKAMMDFLENTPFLELHLACKHIPPWIENAGKYDVSVTENSGSAVRAIVTRRC